MMTTNYKTIIVEGNIAAGKTSFINHLKYVDTKTKHRIKIINEPLEQWQDCRGVDLFRLFNENPKRYAFPFESYIQLTMLKSHQRTIPLNREVKVMERSLFSANHVFVKSLYKDQTLRREEYSILNEWFEYLTNSEPNLKVDLIIYLKTDPLNLVERIKVRGRSEEKNITIKYLELLNESYEQWLSKEGSPLASAPVWTIDANQGLVDLMPVFQQHCDKIYKMFEL